jgi:multidrug efflux pump subunit AcrB
LINFINNFSDISGAVSDENVTISGGNILSGDYRRTLRIDGEFTDPLEIEDVIVKTENNNKKSDIKEGRNQIKTNKCKQKKKRKVVKRY